MEPIDERGGVDLPDLSSSNCCRNCGAQLTGRYCATCGQDDQRGLTPVSTFVRLVLNEAIDLEGPSWRTFRMLFRHPGRLTREYSAGRRRSQVSPLRLYLASAAAYFFLLPLWGEWTVQTDLPSGGSITTSFSIAWDSAPVFAALVPIWAVAVQLAVVDQRRYFEETFAFSAHYHIVFIVFMAGIGLATALTYFVGFPNPWGVLSIIGMSLLWFYMYAGLRTAFDLGRVRAAVTAIILFFIHVFAGGLLFEYL